MKPTTRKPRRKRGTKDAWRKSWPPRELELPDVEELMRLSREGQADPAELPDTAIRT